MRDPLRRHCPRTATSISPSEAVLLPFGHQRRKPYSASRTDASSRQQNKEASRATIPRCCRRYIPVHLAEDGWFWLIPLPDDVMSIGFVGNPSASRQRDGQSTEAMLTAHVVASPTVSARVQGATRVSEVFGTGNYSYRARRSWTANSCMIGNSFAFIDPVFPSCVLMAMTAGEMGERIGWLIYRISTPALRAMFMSPESTFRMRDGLASLLAGNLQRDHRSILPVPAFKFVYHAFSAMNRFRIRTS